jgi:hypothetical protein
MEIVKSQNTLPANHEEEADHLLSSTQGHDRLLKFNKGRYKVGDDEVPLGTQYVAHAGQLTFCWIKFIDSKVADRRMGLAAAGFVPPKREELGDNDQSEWAIVDGSPKDPWNFQHLLPLENLQTGELLIFTTSSIGGKIGTEEVVREYARRLKRKGSRALPIVKLAVKQMPTKKFGDVPRPYFEVEGWEDAPAGDAKLNLAKDFDDEIPFA